MHHWSHVFVCGTSGCLLLQLVHDCIAPKPSHVSYRTLVHYWNELGTRQLLRSTQWRVCSTENLKCLCYFRETYLGMLHTCFMRPGQRVNERCVCVFLGQTSGRLFFGDIWALRNPTFPASKKKFDRGSNRTRENFNISKNGLDVWTTSIMRKTCVIWQLPCSYIVSV